MTMKEAITERHMVRQYTTKAIPADIVELLHKRIAENNETYHLNFALVVGNSDGIGGMAKLLLSKTGGTKCIFPLVTDIFQALTLA